MTTAPQPARISHHSHGYLRGPHPDRPPRTPKPPAFEGRFGRMFPGLKAAQFRGPELEELAKQMIPEAGVPQPDQPNPEENPGLWAGYTYLGQFIDHDLTFDPASIRQRQEDPLAETDYRTPRFDLDSIYGRGPDDQP